MSISLKDKLKKMSPKRHKNIKKRAKELIDEELTLRDLRKALEFTQEELSNKLHMRQDAISRLERRSDLLLSTLASYIHAMGGILNITAKFPHRPPVKITGFHYLENTRENTIQ